MQETLNEMQPWGLTIAQSIFLCGGLFLLILGWSILQFMFNLGKAVFQVGLAVLGVAAVCGGIAFLVYNLAT